MRVQHNITAMNSYRNYNNNTRTINKNIEKLSSGYKVNRAGDDAAGLAISEKMRAQITGLEGAQKNAKDGISLVQTAEGALTEVHSMLNRMYQLAEQSANGTYDDEVDRDQLQKEVGKLRDEINRIADSSNFNGLNLLNGDLGGYTTDVSSDTTVAAVRVSGNGNNQWGDGDQIVLKVDTSGVVSIDSLKLGGVTVASSGAAVASTGFTLPSSAAKAPDSGETGTTTFKIDPDTALTTSTAVSDVYKALGKGLNITLTTKGIPTTDTTYTISLGGGGGGLRLQIGDTADSYNQMDVTIKDIHSTAMEIDDVDISTQEGAAKAMAALKEAINYVSDVRGELGATQNRLEHTINNLSVMQENIQDAESTIRDTDVADEMMKYTKNSILVQSAQAMLAQANQQPQGVLQLLQ